MARPICRWTVVSLQREDLQLSVRSARVGIGSKLTPFAHALFGASHTDIGGDTVPRLPALSAAAWITNSSSTCVRFRRLLRTSFFSDTQNNLRFSAGIVLNF